MQGARAVLAVSCHCELSKKPLKVQLLEKFWCPHGLSYISGLCWSLCASHAISGPPSLGGMGCVIQVDHAVFDGFSFRESGNQTVMKQCFHSWLVFSWTCKRWVCIPNSREISLKTSSFFIALLNHLFLDIIYPQTLSLNPQSRWLAAFLPAPSFFPLHLYYADQKPLCVP